MNPDLFTAAASISSQIILPVSSSETSVPISALVANVAARIPESNRNQYIMSGEGGEANTAPTRSGRRLPLSGGRDAPPLLTLDSRNYEVADFWSKALK
jgi:hypothetical protein